MLDQPIRAAAGRALTASILVALALLVAGTAARLVGFGVLAAALVVAAAGVAGWSLWWFLPFASGSASSGTPRPGVVEARVRVAGVLTRISVTPTGAHARGGGTFFLWCAGPTALVPGGVVTLTFAGGRRAAVTGLGAGQVSLLPVRQRGRRPLEVGAAPDKPR